MVTLRRLRLHMTRCGSYTTAPSTPSSAPPLSPAPSLSSASSCRPSCRPYHIISASQAQLQLRAALFGVEPALDLRICVSCCAAMAAMGTTAVWTPCSATRCASAPLGCRSRKVSSKCHSSGIRASLSNSTQGPEERIDVSRRQALLAALAFTVPSSHLFQPQKDSQALAVDDEKTKIELIQFELKKVLTRGKAAGVLRLAFHDAGTFDSSDNTGGMNGSILFELDRPESAGLQRSIKLLQKVKRELDLAFPVSWADLIAVAGAAAVAECDGPIIPVKLGRLDSSEPDPEGKMPEEILSANALKQAFQSKGFTTQELVALSGAHTIGNKGFGNPNVFDNSYFQILLQKPWKISGPDDGMTSMIGLATDRALADDEECLKWLKVYAADQGRFFIDFAAVYTTLVNTGARWGPPLQA